MLIGKVDRLIGGQKKLQFELASFLQFKIFNETTEISACFNVLTLRVCVQLHTEVCMYLRKHIQGGQWALPQCKQ